MQSNHIIIFSHGFGVRKDDKGLLTDIAKAIPEAKSILFDYNEVDEIHNTLTIFPLSKQAEMLSNVITNAKKVNPEAVIDLICHSQGTVVAALAKPKGIRKTIFLTPVFDMSIERTLARYSSNPDAKIKLDGTSILPSLEGFTRIIPAEYWEERKDIQSFELYNTFAEQTEIIVINANQDQILEKVDLRGLNMKVKVMLLDGDHNFSGVARKQLLESVRGLIV